MAPYTYAKLDTSAKEIRLFTLFRGVSDDPIAGTITHVSLQAPREIKTRLMPLDQLRKTLPPQWAVWQTQEGRYIFWDGTKDATTWSHPDSKFDRAFYEGYLHDHDSNYEPRYEALSYVWGGMDGVEELKIKSSEGFSSADSELRITRNLACALRHLRDSSMNRVLWIDAICIDQDCIEERNAQILRMRDVYRLASRTVIWIGPSADDSSLALDTLELIGKQLEISVDRWQLEYPGAKCPLWHDYGKCPTLPFDHRTWRALSAVFHRPWWDRVWVIQEAQLSNRHAIFQCGHDLIPWSLTRRALNCLDLKVLPMKDLQNKLHQLVGTTVSMSYYSPMRLLRSSQSRECSNPRDKIYGLLSLASEAFAEKIRVDYSASVAEIYRDAFLALVDHTRRLDALAMFSSDRRTPGLPSWVPDWRSPGEDDGTSLSMWCSSGISASVAEFMPPNILNVKGLQICRVQAIGETITGDSIQASQAIRRAWSMASTASMYVDGEPILDAFISTITLDQSREIFAEHPYPTVSDWKKLLYAPILEPLAGGDTAYTPKEYNQIVIRYVTGHSFAVTHEGYIGVVPHTAREGDIICVLLGCIWPIVLRPNPGSSTYEVIGVAFVRGIMHAEAILGPLPSPFCLQYVADEWGYDRPWFLNTETGKRQQDDPRLDPIPDEWEPLSADRTRDDPTVFAKFRNTMDGKKVNSDPRLSPEALAARGVKLKTFSLV